MISATGACRGGARADGRRRARLRRPAGQRSARMSSAPAAFIGGAQAEARKLEQAHLGVHAARPAARGIRTISPTRIFAVRPWAGACPRGLFQEARGGSGLAYNIDAYADTYADHGGLGIYAGAASGRRCGRDRQGLRADEVAKLARRIEDTELARAKAQLKAHMFMAREQRPCPAPSRGRPGAAVRPPLSARRAGGRGRRGHVRRRGAPGPAPAERPGRHRRPRGQVGAEGRRGVQQSVVSKA
ncbi:insulinase family protein [Caulobacter segnis]